VDLGGHTSKEGEGRGDGLSPQKKYGATTELNFATLSFKRYITDIVENLIS